MSRPVTTDHVVMDGNVFHCSHCGQRYQMTLPCPIDVFVAATKAYVATHRNCPPPSEPKP